ncbi:Uncharacterised protein [Serratia rubidaea]|uniref:Uncharacterized protein n=1 Tax=Serratia rubidaea TaxID=61652 RepID=A0A4U9HMQ3_SERRU|nr:Uncharacterised protein [Serratia rubidaea]
MSKTFHILGVSGSLRAASLNSLFFTRDGPRTPRTPEF